MVPAPELPPGLVASRRAPAGALERVAAKEPDPAHADAATWASCERIVGVDRLLDRVARNADDVIQLSPGTLDARLWCLQTRGLQASGGTLNLPIRADGRTPEGLCSLTIRLECPGGAVMNGRALETGSVIVWRPGATYDAISPAGERWVTLLVPWAELPARRDGSKGVGPWRWRSSMLTTHLLRGEAGEVRELARKTQDLSAAGRVAVPAEIAATLRARWLDVGCRLFARAVPCPPPEGAVWSSALDVRDAERHMHARLASSLDLPELCRAIGVRPRTLQGSFQRILRCTPMAYLRTLRLHAALRALRATGTKSPASVAEVARRCGIRHLSRFSAQFRGRFGANPQEILLGARAGEREVGTSPTRSGKA